MPFLKNLKCIFFLHLLDYVILFNRNELIKKLLKAQRIENLRNKKLSNFTMTKLNYNLAKVGISSDNLANFVTLTTM